MSLGIYYGSDSVRARGILAAALLALALTACAPAAVLNAYDGPARTDRDVAVLYTPRDDKGKADGARLIAVHGRAVGTELYGAPEAIKVLPGTVMLKLGCHHDGLRGSEYRLVTAKLEAGHFYEVVCQPLAATYIDRGTDYNSVKHRLPDSVRDNLTR